MSAASPRAALIVMAKRPAPGEVKTRMCPPLAPEEAADLYAAMLEDVIEVSAEAAGRAAATLWLAGHPAEALDELGARCPKGTRLTAQRGADLGARMEGAVVDAAEAGFERILVRGSDSPVVRAEELLAGLDALDDCDLAVGPDAGGGYAWIALRGARPGLFDHPMSTDRVLRDTLSRAHSAGLRTRCLGACFDIDTAADLGRLADARRLGRARACPRTLALLDTRDHWRHVA